MKKPSAGFPHTKFIAAASAFIWTIAIATSARGAQLEEARVTQIVNDVKLLLEQAAPRSAVVNDLVRRGNAVRTGTQSRSELTFSDLTITRLGANTIFSFKEGTREMNLTDGAILFQVPKGSGGVTIRTVGVTAAITGTTGIGEFHPATSSRPLFSKWLCLEGTFRLYLPNGQSLDVGPGKMVTTDGKSFSKVMTFDIKKLVSTSLFFTGFDQTLASMNLIMLESQNQLTSGLLATSTTNPLDPTRIVNVTSQAIVAEEAQTPPPPPPTPPPPPPTPTTPPPTPTAPPPTPTKFGTPSTITSPNPYLITNGTVITTDPSITTNGVTDFGKIYRSPMDDGAFSLWAFGSTSAFDTSLRIDDIFFADPGHLPIAVFKFENLSLTGDPTIDTSSDVTKLALIGVDGITSGPPGGPLTFTGLDLLVLATVNGSINLTSDVSFQDLNELVMYARGAGSDLTINSSISNIGLLGLAAENSIQLTNPGTMSVGEFDAITDGGDLMVQIGGSLLLNGKVRLDAILLPGATVASGANLTLNVTGDYMNNSATEFSRLAITNRGHIGTGGNIAVDITGNLTASGPGSATDFPAPGDVQLLIQNTNAQIDNGGNLNLTVNGNVQVNGLIADLQNYNFTSNPAGHIGTGGNIDVEVGGNLTANSYVDVFLNNRGGGMIDSGGNLTFNVDGALTIGPGPASGSGYAQFAVSNRYDDSAGNTTPPVNGSDVSLYFHAGSVNITLPPGPDTFFSTLISNRGGTIDGNASVNFNVSQDVSVLCDADIDILNDGGTNPGVQSPFGGTIHGDATLQVSAANFSANSLFVHVTNRNGGVIDSNATLSFNLAGNLTTQGEATVQISNNQNEFSNGLPGGSIGSAATLTINAANVSVGTDFIARIFNDRSGTAPGPGAGSIGTDAMLNISAGSFSVGGNFDASISNNNNNTGNGNGGSIGRNAAINANITNTLTSGGNATFQISNQSNLAGSPGGSIGGDATINVSSANISTGVDSFGSSLDGLINNATGNIGGNASVFVNVTNDITAQGPANFQILNNDGGHIGGTANILVATGGDVGDLTADSIFAFINSRNGGSIDSGATLGFNVGGTLTTTGDATFGTSNRNDGSGGGTIGSLAAVGINAASISVGGFFQTFISTNGGGSIQGEAINAVNSSGDLTAQDGILLDITTTIFGGTGNFTGGHIGGNAVVALNAQNIITPSTASGVPGTDTMALEASIYPNASGTVGGDALVDVSATQDISAPGSVLFWVANGNYQNLGPGMIGGNAEVNVSASNISSGDFFDQILNYGGASIGGNATIDVTTNTLSVGGNLDSRIDNTKGTIGGNAAISMNVSGNAAITNDATFQIFGSDGAKSASIDFNGGNYNAGGMFLAYMDGNGTITFNNASAHADVLKAGVFGTNGVLNIGGGTLSADSTLKLYAPGSNGQLNFVSNVTLGGNSAKILAANSVTIFNNVVVTIGGPNPADVYTGFTGEIPNANYTGFGGNDSTTGTFAGAGANAPQPLSKVPPFDPVSRATARTGGSVTSNGNRGKKIDSVIHVSSSDELLSLLDRAAPGPGGKITIPHSKSTSNSRNSNRTDVADRLKAGSRVNADRHAMDMRTVSSSVIRRSPQ